MCPRLTRREVEREDQDQDHPDHTWGMMAVIQTWDPMGRYIRAGSLGWDHILDRDMMDSVIQAWDRIRAKGMIQPTWDPRTCTRMGTRTCPPVREKGMIQVWGGAMHMILMGKAKEEGPPRWDPLLYAMRRVIMDRRPHVGVAKEANHHHTTPGL